MNPVYPTPLRTEVLLLSHSQPLFLPYFNLLTERAHEESFPQSSVGCFIIQKHVVNDKHKKEKWTPSLQS